MGILRRYETSYNDIVVPWSSRKGSSTEYLGTGYGQSLRLGCFSSLPTGKGRNGMFGEEERNVGTVNRTHRRMLRKFHLRLLKRAYTLLTFGQNERAVCAMLGISPDIMKGALKPAVEEVLWERGHLPQPAL